MGYVMIGFGLGTCVGIFFTLVIIALVNKKESKFLDDEIKRLENEYLEKYGHHQATWREMYKPELKTGEQELVHFTAKRIVE